MTKAHVISAAFNHLAKMLLSDLAKNPDFVPVDSHTLLLAQGWDEKLFKVQDGVLGSNGISNSTGNWMARVCKEGPQLTLTPTMDPGHKPIRVHGRQFWKLYAAALASERHRLGQPEASAEGTLAAFYSAVEPAVSFALNRWDRSQFLKWTQKSARPQGEERQKERPASAGRQAYSMFYQ